MSRIIIRLCAFSTLLLACESPPADVGAASETRVEAASSTLGETAGQEVAEPASQPTAESTQDPPAANGSATNAAAAHDELAALDHRIPVPLQPMMAWHQKQNMMEHLVAIERITAGLANEDWGAIAEASALIESSPQMQQMCEHMGSGADGFTELALEFHRRADAIGEAARAEDARAVLQATAHTLGACTSCHASYRQNVVDAPTWEMLTGSAHQPAMHGHGH